jgi:hypothetical protein
MKKADFDENYLTLVGEMLSLFNSLPPRQASKRAAKNGSARIRVVDYRRTTRQTCLTKLAQSLG